MNYLESCKLIVTQLGKECLFLLSAKKLSAGTNQDNYPEITFAIGNNSMGITHISIAANLATDNYNVSFFSRGNELTEESFKPKSYYNDIGVENLHDLIESETGLYVSFKNRI